MLIPKEDAEQQALVQWLKLQKIDFFAPINENVFSFLSRDIAIKLERKVKSMGKVKGVTDLVIFLPNKILFLELKRQPKKLKSGKISYANSKVSKEQEDFKIMVNKYSYTSHAIAYGWQDARIIIEELI